MNQFKSIWGLMLGILLLGVNRPAEAGLTPYWFTISEAHEDKDGDALRRPRAQGRFKAYRHKPALICKLVL